MKIKNLLIALVVLALPVTAWADNVAKIGEAEYETLQAAVDAANAGDVIELLQNIDLTTVTTSPSDKYNVNVDKSITIDGKGYTVSSSAGKRAIVLTGEGNDITLKNLKVVNNGSEACLWIANNLTCTLDAVTLDGTNGKSYNQPLTIGSISAEGRVTLNVTNGSVIKTNDAGTAHYAIIAWHPADITVANSSLIGWANVYLKSGADGSIVNISNSTLKSQGISGATNNFSMFTTECGNNTITLTDNNITLNPAADTYMTLITLGGSDNTVQVKGEETTFTTSDLARGGISHQKGDFENNTVTFDEATHSTFAAAINALKEEGVTDTEAGGTYTLGYVCDVYYYWITNGVENGGNYDFDEPFVNNWLADGEFIRLRKDVTLTKNIACLLTSGSFTLTQGEYAVTKGKYSVALKQGVSVNTDKQTDIFTAENADCKVVETATDGGYTYTVIEKTYVAQVGEDKYETLEEAFAAVQGVETITLLSDVTLADEMVLALEGKAITLNLNGKTLNGRTNLTSGNLTIRNGNVELAGGQPLNVYGSATAGTENYSVLTIAEDTKVSGKYGVCMFGPAASSKAGYGAVINVAGEVSGTDGTIFVSGNLGNNIEGDMNNVVNITGKVIGNDNAGVALNGNATVNVKNGAEITGNTAIAIKRGTLNVEDRATVHATGEKNLEPEANNNGTEMTGAAISMTDTYNKYGAMSVNITGGSIMSDNAPALFKKKGSYSNEATFTVSGGTFSSEVPEEFCAEGYIPADLGNGTYGVKEGSYVAQVDDAKYETLAEAVEAAQGTSVVTLLADVAETYTMSENETLKIKKNGFKFEVAAPEGDFKVETEEADGVTTYTVVALSMEEKDIVLVDGEPYTVTADTQVKSATYTRNYAADRVGKFQAWSMPFDFTITEEAAEKFTFYRINMIAHSANPNDEVQNTDQVWIYVAPMKAGEKLTANRPYAYKPKTEGEFTFTADNNKLYAPDYTSRLHTETVDHSYDFYGTYDTVSIANQGGDFYYMSGSGKISHATQENTTVGSYRWIVKATNKSGANYAPRFEFVEEGAETEGIRSISAGDDVEGYYTLGGTRVETPHHGMFVVKYKNGNIKKQFIK